MNFGMNWGHELRLRNWGHEVGLRNWGHAVGSLKVVLIDEISCNLQFLKQHSNNVIIIKNLSKTR